MRGVARFAVTAVLMGGCIFLAPARGVAQVTHFESEVSANKATVIADLSSFSSTQGATLTIRNNSASTLDFPFIWNSASPVHVTSLPAFVSLASKAPSDEAFAIGVWQYVSGQTNAYCSAGSTNMFVDDPMEILYGYGFGCCSQLAMTLASLWHAAGGDVRESDPAVSHVGVLRRYPVRLAVMAFHTVPEIYYDNAWHMLDPDHRVFYRNPDGSIASVAQIIANPSLVANTPDGIGWNSETMAELYESNAATLQYEPLSITIPANPLFTLLPMESMQLMQQNAWPTAVYEQTTAVEPPPPYINIGEIGFERSISINADWPALFDQYFNVQSAVQADGRMALVNATAGTGAVIISRSSPFPILGLGLSGEFFDNDPAGSVAIETSSDGINWSAPIFLPLEESGSSMRASLDLSSALATANAYYIEIWLHGSSAGTVGLYNLQVRMDGQMAGQMFPLLQPGQVNSFDYQDLSLSSQQRSVQIDLAVPVGSRELKDLKATSLIPENNVYSIAAGYAASNLVDGDELTLAYPGNTQLDYAIALSAVTHVKQVSVWWGYFGADPVYINSWRLYSRSGLEGDWNLIAEGGFPNAVESDIAVDVIATDLRLTASGDNWIGVYEFKAYGDELSPRGLVAKMDASSMDSTQLAPVSVSSNVPISPTSGYPTSNLTDGNGSTPAYPGAPEVDYELDFGSDTLVDFANVTWGYFGTSPIYVQGWTLFGQRDGDFGWTALAQGGYPNANETQADVRRYVRRLRLRADSLNWIGVYDLSVFGIPSE